MRHVTVGTPGQGASSILMMSAAWNWLGTPIDANASTSLRASPVGRNSTMATTVSTARQAATIVSRSGRRVSVLPGSESRYAIQSSTLASGSIPRMLPQARKTFGILLPSGADYSSTWMFFSAHMSLRIWGHTVTDTSPRCALRRRYMYVRDWPMPPPIESGISSLRIPW